MYLGQSPFPERFNKVLRTQDVLAPNLFDSLMPSITTEAHKLGEYRFPVAAPNPQPKIRVQQNRGGTNRGLHKPAPLPQQHHNRSDETSEVSTPAMVAASREDAVMWHQNGGYWPAPLVDASLGTDHMVTAPTSPRILLQILPVGGCLSYLS